MDVYAVEVRVVAVRTVYVEAESKSEARRLATEGPEAWYDADALYSESPDVLSAGSARAVTGPSDMGRPG